MSSCTPATATTPTPRSSSTDRISPHSVSRFPGNFLIPSAWDFVADLDPAFRWSTYHLPTTLTKFAVAVGPFPDKLALEFDPAMSTTLQSRVRLTGQLTQAIGKTVPAKCADTLAAGMVDLTCNPAKPAYGGFQDDQTFYVGSLAKLYPLFAAFELRSRVRRIVDKALAAGVDPTKPGWERPVTQAIEEAWKAGVSAKRFGHLDTSFPRRFPKLSTIFDFRDDGSGVRVRFKKGGATRDEVDDVDDIQERHSVRCPTERMAFQEWLDLMIRWSNNCAADRVITALGYPYINAVLREAGFQSEADLRKGPLFISGSYMGNDWERLKDLGQLGPLGTKHYKGTTNFVGNPLQVARLLTFVATHRAFGGCLAGQQDCDEMMGMMLQGTGIKGVGSFIGEDLEALYPGTPPVSSKIGIGDPPGTVPDKPMGAHDAAIVQRITDHGKTIRYALVILGGYSSDVPPNAPDPEAIPLFNLIRGLDLWIAS